MLGPYSNFAVGAALKTTTGEIFTGNGLIKKLRSNQLTFNFKKDATWRMEHTVHPFALKELLYARLSAKDSNRSAR